MNLIEQLGGYEKCKEIVNQPHADIIMNAQGLREVMLEYRREHGIFEVGDWVVCEPFESLVCVIDLFEDRLIIDTGIKTTPDSKSTMAMALPSDMFRHATPAEIQAEKRLD